jgi:DNA modification methylase
MNWRDRVKEFRRVPASQLKANPKNWREHPPEQQRAMQGVLDEVGIAGALLARETPDGLELIDGHLRTEMADDTEWPVLVLDVDENEADVLLASVDPIGALAKTNADQLASLLGQIETENADLDSLLSELEKSIPTQIADGETDPDDIPTDDRIEKRCEPGDLWIMGSHRLLCGDSTSADDMERLLDGAKPALCITDPPYGIQLDQGWRDRLGIKRMGKAQDDVLENDDRADWSDVWNLMPCDVIYHWCAGGVRQIEAGMGILESGYEIRFEVIWNKTIATMSRGAYHGKHEPCWYAVKKGSTARWIGDRKQTTVWDAASPKHIMGGSTEEKFDHPTQKPIELFTRAIVNHEGDVLEPFAGSGTCVIACEQTGRTCYAMEIDTHYCDTILARWEAFTGGKAERA